MWGHDGYLVAERTVAKDGSDQSRRTKQQRSRRSWKRKDDRDGDGGRDRCLYRAKQFEIESGRHEGGHPSPHPAF
ncbi:hypothetical protein GCM10017744_038650 [Streptomyces antimycoticus]|uniref:Uncharacterized protein n=1 Tax=Streptomyces antimycoticus TaxID=68175 RepID=A0A4D4K8P4_9ACTN|nr:hypothetical protein SHXM_06858 [Streptomyces hygroscopicus]GDY45511.1 hypothetical protein SANT12839_063930 [Streptomyces antimycoticus]